MNHYPRIANSLLIFAILLLLAALVAAFGCSRKGYQPVSPQPEQAREQASGGLNFGHFQILLDEASWQLRIEPVNGREADWDVTEYADFGIIDMQWDPASRNWTISTYLKNISSLTGYGVWAVFTELGKKEIVLPDGFIYTKPPGIKRVPVIAFWKEEPKRPCWPMTQYTRDIIIHWPGEVNKWIPIEFYIDAAWPNERKMPVVENLHISTQSGLSGVNVITAEVFDWQDPGVDLTVWADFTSIGGGIPIMYDDGEHNDGDAGDGTFGGFFIDNATEPANYTNTVYAQDPAGHIFENDIKHFFSGGVPEECFEYTVLAEGNMGNIQQFQELVIDDLDALEEYWIANFGSTNGMPTVDFDTERVIAINMGGKSSSGYGIEIDRMCVDPWVDCLAIDVDYIRRHPGEGCIILPVCTSPYWVGKIPKTEHMIFFFGMDYVYKCHGGEGSLNSWPVTRGYDSQLVNFGEYFIDNLDDWETFWLELTGSSSGLPFIDFDQDAVVAITMGTVERAMHFTDVRSILFDTSGTTPIYKARYAYVTPPEVCYSCYIPTVPYGIWRIQKPEHPVEFDPYDHEMTCD